MKREEYLNRFAYQTDVFYDLNEGGYYNTNLKKHKLVGMRSLSCKHTSVGNSYDSVVFTVDIEDDQYMLCYSVHTYTITLEPDGPKEQVSRKMTLLKPGSQAISFTNLNSGSCSTSDQGGLIVTFLNIEEFKYYFEHLPWGNISYNCATTDSTIQIGFASQSFIDSVNQVISINQNNGYDIDVITNLFLGTGQINPKIKLNTKFLTYDGINRIEEVQVYMDTLKLAPQIKLAILTGQSANLSQKNSRRLAADTSKSDTGRQYHENFFTRILKRDLRNEKNPTQQDATRILNIHNYDFFPRSLKRHRFMESDQLAEEDRYLVYDNNGVFQSQILAQGLNPISFTYTDTAGHEYESFYYSAASGWKEYPLFGGGGFLKDQCAIIHPKPIKISQVGLAYDYTGAKLGHTLLHDYGLTHSRGDAPYKRLHNLPPINTNNQYILDTYYTFIIYLQPIRAAIADVNSGIKDQYIEEKKESGKIIKDIRIRNYAMHIFPPLPIEFTIDKQLKPPFPGSPKYH